MTIQYIYLLLEPEFIKTKESIFMIKKSTQPKFVKLKGSKDSVLLMQICCCNYVEFENQIIELFKKKYIQRKDIGIKYFEGDYKEMMGDIVMIHRRGDFYWKDDEKISTNKKQQLNSNTP